MSDQIDQPSADATAPVKPARRRVPQSKVPRVSLSSTLRVPRALADHFAKEPARPLDIAAALNMSPTSGTFRSLCGAALGYGLTTGGPNAQSISLTDLGRRIVSPLLEGDESEAMREAILTPSVERDFLERYDGNPLPAEHIAHNVLETMGVPLGATARVYTVIRENARAANFIKTIRDKDYVDLSAVQRRTPLDQAEASGTSSVAGPSDQAAERVETTTAPGTSSQAVKQADSDRVFVSGSANPEIAEQIAALLEFGGREAVAKTELEASNTSHLLALTDEMRECSSGVFFLSTQAALDSPSTTESTLLELGAAVALFGSRCVLVVEAGAHVPRWLAGLPNVTCSSGELTLTDITAIVSALMSANGETE